MKKIIALLIYCLALSVGTAQNNILRGIVKLQSSGSKSLDGVKVSAFGASPAYSNSSGMFELIFSNKQPGSSISLIIEKEGFELINEKELENCVIRERADDLAIVVMAKKGERNKQALAYYNIILENTSNNFQNELKNINNRLNELDEDDDDRQVLLQQIADLQDQKKSLIDRAEELAKQLSTTDLDQASSMAKAAYVKFQSGDIKGSLAILDDESLDKNFNLAKKEKSDLNERLVLADNAFQQSIENYMIKARFCISDRKYDEAYNNYLKAVEADSLHVNNLAELAAYCSELNQQDKAIKYYEQALRVTNTEVTKAELLNNLGEQLMHDNNFPNAKKVLLESFEIRAQLVNENPQRYESDLAATQMNLGILYAELNEYVEAENQYLKSLEIRRRLANANPKIHEADLAETQFYLGKMYSLSSSFDKAEAALLESLRTRKKLAKENATRYEHLVALTQDNLGVMYHNLRASDKEEKAYLESFEIKKRLAKENPQRYEPELAKTQMNLGVLYRSLRQEDKAETMYLAALDRYKQLAKENPQRYELTLALTLGNLGVLYHSFLSHDQAIAAYSESIEMIKRLAQKNPERCEPILAIIVGNLGSIHAELQDFEKAEAGFLEALEVYTRLAEKNPQRFNLGLVRTLLNLSEFKREMLERNLDISFKAEGIELIHQAKDLLAQSDQTLPKVQFHLQAATDQESYLQEFTEKDFKALALLNEALSYEDANRIEKDLPIKIANQEKVVALYEDALEKYSKNRIAISRTGQANVDLARFYLSNSQFKLAEGAARRAMLVDKTQHATNSLVALSLLYQGQQGAAEEIYLGLNEEPYKNGTLKGVFLEDLSALENEGITCEGAGAIRALLEE